MSSGFGFVMLNNLLISSPHEKVEILLHTKANLLFLFD